MTRFMMRRLATKLVEAYTGDVVEALDIEPDPRVPNTFAIRADVRHWSATKTRHEDFLIERTPLDRATEEDLAEVEWLSWPPEVRR